MSDKTEITAHFASLPSSILEAAALRIHRVIAASDVRGHATLVIVFSPRRFTDVNSRTMAALLAAMDEVNAVIARQPERAAESFIRLSAVKMAPSDVLAMIKNPDTPFDTTLHGVLAYAEFMGRVGSIKAKPAV